MVRQGFARVSRMWLLCAGIALLAGGCPFNTLLERPTKDVTPPLPAQEPGDPAEIGRSLTNQPPQADAGADATYSGGDPVLLTATDSTDPDSDPLTYQWQQIGGTPTVEFGSSPSASMVDFVAPEVAVPVTLTFRVTVKDGFAYDAADVHITIRP